MANKERPTTIKAGEKSYLRWREELRQNPEYHTVYDDEAAKSELWLQLVEARQEAGLTQKQMAERIGVSQAQVTESKKKATTLIPSIP